MGGKLTDFTTHDQASKSKQTKWVRREASVLSTTAAQVLFFSCVLRLWNIYYWLLLQVLQRKVNHRVSLNARKHGLENTECERFVHSEFQSFSKVPKNAFVSNAFFRSDTL